MTWIILYLFAVLNSVFSIKISKFGKKVCLAIAGQYERRGSVIRILRLRPRRMSLHFFGKPKSQLFNILLPSISSTLNVQIFCTNIAFRQLFSSYMYVKNDVCTNNLYAKCWWNWHLVFISLFIIGTVGFFDVSISIVLILIKILSQIFLFLIL
jgi:hypothetical protein